MANTKKYVSLDKLGVYDEKIKGVITAGDGATLQSAKDYADGLASNYDAAGSAASAEAAAKAYADGLAGNYDASGAAAAVEGKLNEEIARAKLAEEANAAAAKQAQDEVDALELVVKNIQENAYDDTEIVNRVAAVEANKADKTQVATDIADAVKVEEEARIAAVAGVQGAVDGLAGTHATDKKALEDAIALKADQTALDGVSAVANAAVKQADYDVKVKALEDKDAEIIGLVNAEAERAAGVEAGLEERLVEVETFFKTAEGETIDEALDTLVELQTYLNGEGAVADQMLLDIAANKKAIEDHVATDHDFAAADEALEEALMAEINKKADKTTVEGIDGRLTTAEGKITTLEGEMDAAEGRLDAVEGAVATKAEAQALADAVEALEGADAGQVGRIAALEAKFGGAEGSVEDMIADAKQEAIDAAASAADAKDEVVLAAAKKYADDEDAKIEERVGVLEAASATHALAADLTALGNRVTAEEGKVATLQTEMDAVEALAAANKAAHEANAAAIALKASQADLEAVSGRVTTLETWHNNFTECSEEEINALFA